MSAKIVKSARAALVTLFLGLVVIVGLFAIPVPENESSTVGQLRFRAKTAAK